MTQATYQRVYTPLAIDEAISLVTNRIKGVHEACAAVYEISAQDFDELVKSIDVDGLLRPVEIDSEGRLIDGRSRIQAYAALGLTLEAKDIVVTDVDPWAVARSNNARRHLTACQKAMAAARLLEKEKEWATERKRQGAEKGRKSRKCSLGTESVPSGEPPKKRAPRSVDIVAAKTGVSREKIAAADRIRKADPVIAKQVEQGDRSLEDALKSIGCDSKIRTKPSIPKRGKPKAKESSLKGKTEASTSVWKDEHVEITDLPDGIRTMRCPSATFYIHKSQDLIASVMHDRGEWCWHVGVINDLGSAEHREDAEKAVLNWFASNRKDDA